MSKRPMTRREMGAVAPFDGGCPNCLHEFHDREKCGMDNDVPGEPGTIGTVCQCDGASFPKGTFTSNVEPQPEHVTRIPVAVFHEMFQPRDRVTYEARWKECAEDYARERAERQRLSVDDGNPGYAVCVLLTQKGTNSAWMAQRSRHAKVLPGYLECVAGKVDPGETPLQAARRETNEETGLRDLAEHRFRFCGRIRERGVGPMNVVMDLYIVELESYEVPRQTEPDKRGSWCLGDSQAMQRFTPAPGLRILMAILDAQRVA